MGEACLMAVLAAVFAYVFGYIVGSECYRAIERRVHVGAALVSGRRARVLLYFENGCRVLKPAARAISGVPYVRDLVEETRRLLGQYKIHIEFEELLTWMLFVPLALCALCGLMTCSFVCGIALSVCVTLLSVNLVRSVRDKHCNAMRAQVPEAIRSMSVCFRSGLSLFQTLHQVAGEIGGALGGEFAVAAQRLELGSSVNEALCVLREVKQVPEMSFVAVALDVQHQSGGSMAAVLDAARESVEDELELLRSLRVQTAQAKLSARIVTVMPFVLIALFSLMSSDFLTPFFSSFAGMCLLGVALSMQMAGVLSVRKMLQVEVG